MKIVTTEQIRDLDHRAMTEIGIPGVVLMENAGRAVVDILVKQAGTLRGKRIGIFCGGGNNGGDGFVIARHLKLLGSDPVILLTAEPRAGTDARIHFDALRALGFPISDLTTQTAERFDYVVDALLGTGLRSAPSPLLMEAIGQINRAKCPVFSVDVPSGLHSDTGALPGGEEGVVHATETITFAYPKIGLFLAPGSEYVGTLHVADIGMDWERLGFHPDYLWFTEAQAQKVAQPLFHRHRDAHKGDFGHIGVIAGSQGMVGAPAMLARAAQRMGAGLVTLLTSASAQPILAQKLDEQMTVPLPEQRGSLAETAFDAIQEFLPRFSVLCVGPGLTTAPQTARLVQRLISEVDLPIVLDADGLNALALSPDCAKERAAKNFAPLLLTPHPGEAARLLGTSIAEVQSNRLASVRRLSERYFAVALLKGSNTLITAPHEPIRVNSTGNPGMATGGSGDTLTGVIGGILAHKSYRAASLESMALGAWLHGYAGDLAMQSLGATSLVAGDILEHLPKAIRHLEEKA